MYLSLLEIITVGFPFCSFKIIAGLFFKQNLLLSLGVIDLIFNALNFGSILFSGKLIVDTCFFSFLVNRLKRPPLERKIIWIDFGNSIDVMFSFLLVAFVIGGGFISQLPNASLMIWNISVIFNVIGAGLTRIYASLKNLKRY